MPRKLLVRNNSLPYHVTARTNNREEFPITMGRVWDIAGQVCWYLSRVYGVEIQAFVLMPNHFHMILTVPESDLGFVMNEFMKSVSRTVGLISGRSGHLFGGPYYWSLIKNSRYFGHALKYVYRNPVRAHLCMRVEDYPYSTLSGLLGLSHLPFPLFYTRVGLEAALPAIETYDQLGWLNTPFPAEAEALIKKGLKRKLFDVIVDRKKRKPVGILNNLV